MPPAGTVRLEGPQGIMADLSYPSHRRGDQRAQPALRAGDLVLDEARWTVHRAGRQVDLSPTEFRLLAYLMRNQGQVLTRAQLLENVWGWNRSGQSQIVETYVSYLRRKLDAFGPRLIHTRRGVGYLLRSADGGVTAPYRDESLRLS
jgi:two-component system, OmpR family, response regulator